MKKYHNLQCGGCNGLSKFVEYNTPGYAQCCRCVREQIEDEELRFSSIVYIQGDEAGEALDVLEKDGHKALLEYLKQWDYGDNYDEERKPKWGTEDRKIMFGNYVISQNRHIPSVGLTLLSHPLPDDGDYREKLFLEYWESLTLQESYDLVYSATAGLDDIWEDMKADAQHQIEKLHTAKTLGVEHAWTEAEIDDLWEKEWHGQPIEKRVALVMQVTDNFISLMPDIKRLLIKNAASAASTIKNDDNNIESKKSLKHLGVSLDLNDTVEMLTDIFGADRVFTDKDLGPGGRLKG